MGQLAMMHVHGAEFGTTVQRGDGLARVEQAIGIERMLDSMKLQQFTVIELHAHLVDFFHANAVFAGDGAADFNADFQDPAAQLLGSLEFALDIGIIEDQRMQVAVAGMENIDDRQLVFFRQLIDVRQNGRYLVAWNGAIHAVVVGRQAAHCRESRLAAGPEFRALLFVCGNADFTSAGAAQNLLRSFKLVGNLGAGAIDFT